MLLRVSNSNSEFGFESGELRSENEVYTFIGTLRVPHCSMKSVQNVFKSADESVFNNGYCV